MTSKKGDEEKLEFYDIVSHETEADRERRIHRKRLSKEGKWVHCPICGRLMLIAVIGSHAGSRACLYMVIGRDLTKAEKRVVKLRVSLYKAIGGLLSNGNKEEPGKTSIHKPETKRPVVPDEW